MKPITFASILLMFGLIFNSCENENEIKIENTTNQIIVDNDAISLNKRVSANSQDIILTELNTKSKTKSLKATNGKEYKLVLRATVSSPTISSKTLRASHIKIYNDFVYVSYNYEGAEYAGGIDVFNISDINNPKLISQALFPIMDISAIDCNNNKLYAAGSIDIDKANKNKNSDPAILQIIKLKDNTIEDTAVSIGLKGYVATSVVVDNTSILATTGDNGAFYIIDKTSLTTLYKEDKLDLRSIATNGTTKALMQGTPVNIFTYNSNNIISGTFNIANSSIPSSKSYIDIDDKYTYVPCNENGLKIINTSNGNEIASFDRPSIPSGENSNDYVTNGVSVLEDFIFIANGAGGLYIAEKNSEGIPIMKVSADLGASANFTQAKRNSNGNIIIFVATGTGGLKILELVELSRKASVTTLESSKITGTTAQLNGKVISNGGSAITERGFIYSTDSLFSTQFTVSQNIDSIGEYHISIDNLSENKRYFVKSFVTNSMGTNYGEISSFIASDEVTVVIPATVNPDGENKTFKFKWISVGDVQIMDRNLGADKKNSTPTDVTSETRGWYWQFNKIQAYRSEIENPTEWATKQTTTPKWSATTGGSGNWESSNDPCKAIDESFRVPTADEWNAMKVGGYVGNAETFYKLNLLYGGNLYWSNGGIQYLETYGAYWSSTQYDSYSFGNSFSSLFIGTTATFSKMQGLSIRCVKNK